MYHCMYTYDEQLKFTVVTGILDVATRVMGFMCCTPLSFAFCHETRRLFWSKKVRAFMMPSVTYSFLSK